MKNKYIWFLIGFLLGLFLILSYINFNAPREKYLRCYKGCEEVWGKNDIRCLGECKYLYYGKEK